ncbi:MAG: glycine cleavage system transcriptional repressor [Alphaproteobacteria bacterium]|jgi:glycine cleavage system transcriptional repressor
MQEQLIINILGKSSLLALSNITACISKYNCNILDSRHAQYGTDFSLTMIVSGAQSAVTLLEIELSTLCVTDDLLCMMKRTTGHRKQNIEQVINLAFSGNDASGVMHNVTQGLATYGVSVSAVRQKTYAKEGQNILECKMILTTPKTTDLPTFDTNIKSLLHGMGLHGKISHNPIKENDEYTESW